MIFKEGKFLIFVTVLFVSLSIFLFVREPMVSAKVELKSSVVGIKALDGKALPVFSEDRDFIYSPDSFTVKLGDIYLPITIRPYESFLSQAVYELFSFSVYSIFIFNTALGIFLIFLAYRFGSITAFLVALSLPYISSLIDKNSYYVGSILVVASLFKDSKDFRSYIPFVLIIAILLNAKLGLSIFFSIFISSILQKSEFKSVLKSILFTIFGLIPYLISYISINSRYSASNFLLAPPSFEFFRLPDFPEVPTLITILVLSVAYILSLRSNELRSLSIFAIVFVCSQFLLEFVFYYNDAFKFFPSFLLSIFLLGGMTSYYRKVLYVPIIGLFLIFHIYKMLYWKPEAGYYSYRSVKELSDYLVENGVRNPSVLSDVPLGFVSSGKLRPIYWHQIWDFVKKKEKNIYVDLREFSPLLLKMNSGRYLVIDATEDEYNEINMARIKSGIDMRRIKEIVEQNRLIFIIAYIM
ncbi:MAG: hypothetical protein N2254_05745 [bacterium]|nr:hypothetical protein [bacterium]